MALTGELSSCRGWKRRRIRDSTPSLVRTLGQQHSTSTHRWPKYSSHCELVKDYRSTANAVRINEAKKMEPPISRALLPSSMSQNRRNETPPPVQSKTGAMTSSITPELEVSPKANLDSVESASARNFACELYRPDRSRPTHSVISESVGNNSTPEASAKVILATSLDTHVPLKLLLQKLTLS
jgi:hypothetical protein